MPISMQACQSVFKIDHPSASKIDPSNSKSGLWVKQTNSLSIVRASFEKIGFSTETRADAKFTENVIGVYVGPYPQ